MNKRSLLNKNVPWSGLAAIVMYTAIILLIIYAKVLGHQSYEAFLTITREDGIAEWLTAGFLFASCIVFVSRSITASRHKNYRLLVISLLLIFLFFFATGEEISWGQRIFNLKSGEFFQEKNLQKEINFHNLQIGGVKLNKLIFSNLMFAMLVFYFILLKPLVRWSGFFRRNVIHFGIPVPRYHHIGMLILTVSLVLFVPPLHLVRESELYEMSVAGILFLVFLQPSEVA